MATPVQKTTILLPGGLGYIGSHIIVELLTYLIQSQKISFTKILIVDNLSNSSLTVLDRIKEIIKSEHPNFSNIDSVLEFEKLDILNLPALESVFSRQIELKTPISSIIHLAAKKAVGESVKFPVLYYENNFIGTINILKCMDKYECKKIIFSSTATVYGCNDKCHETSPINPLHPYSSTKVCMEYAIRDMTNSKSDWKSISLRYFNPAGAHPSGLIGDSPTIFPNNLFPFLEQVMIGRREKLTVFGNDYNTHDGTGVRDYLHVVDLAKFHIAALEKLENIKGYEVYNVGSAKGYSVLDIVNTYSKVTGKNINYVMGERRPGDVDILVCVCEKAEKELNMKIQKTLEDMCRDSYNFVLKNPDGIK